MKNKILILISTILITFVLIGLGFLLIQTTQKKSDNNLTQQNLNVSSIYSSSLSMSTSSQPNISSNNASSLNNTSIFNLNLPSMNFNQQTSGSYEVSIKLNITFKVTRRDNFGLSIENNNLKAQLGAVTGDFGYGFLTFIPEHTSVSNTFNKNIIRYIETDTGSISDIKTQIGMYQYYYTYTDQFKTGKDCNTASNYSCPSPYFTLKDNLGNEQPFSFSCGVNNKIQASDCDLIFNALNITKLYHQNNI